jgi:hypothetical protein
MHQKLSVIGGYQEPPSKVTRKRESYLDIQAKYAGCSQCCSGFVVQKIVEVKRGKKKRQ